MRRREFIRLLGGAAVLAPFSVQAQQADRVRRVGILLTFSDEDAEAKAWLAAFRQGLERRGWREGRNLHIDIRSAAARGERIPGLAKELIALQPDVLLAQSTAAARALQRETRTLPIVFVHVSDPVGAGIVSSLARPDANLTGVLHYEAGIVGKWLAMLKEMSPRLARVAVLANSKTTAFDYFLRSAQGAAPSVGVEVIPSRIETAADIERAIEEFARVPDSGLLLPPDATTILHQNLIVRLAARHQLPAVYPMQVFVKTGGLMSYGTDQDSMFRLAAAYVDRILRGDKPADLPVQAPTRYETAVNLKAAKALGLTVPPGLLVAADEVIE
jgi:putative ABC transport system substrate-binding protein